MIHYDAAPGVHLVEHAYTNCVVVEGDDGVTVIDACFPKTWSTVAECLQQIGRSPEDIRGLIITHGHFDHVGFASHIQQRYGVRVWAHPADFRITRHPYRYKPEIPRIAHPLVHPGGWPILGRMVVAGALRVPGVTADAELTPGATLPLPGDPVVIHTPGHTNGSCVIQLPERRVLVTGDALVTLDPYTGHRGPRAISRSATHDLEQAVTSLEVLRGLPVDRLLPGHGDVYVGDVDAAVSQVRVNSRV